MCLEDTFPHGQNEKPAGVEKEPQIYGLSFEEALESTADTWQGRLENEGYPGDTSHAAKCMVETIKGIRFLYEELIRRGIISKDQNMPRVDFDDLPGFSILFFKPVNTNIASWDYLRRFEGYELETSFERRGKYEDAIVFKGSISDFKPVNTIIASWDYLSQFEGYELETSFERRGKYEDTIVFKGSISEFLFLKGVEELTHALDTVIGDVLSPTDPSIGQIQYYSQEHEYKALKWQLRAAQMNSFSNEALNSISGLLGKVSKSRRSKTE